MYLFPNGANVPREHEFDRRENRSKTISNVGMPRGQERFENHWLPAVGPREPCAKDEGRRNNNIASCPCRMQPGGNVLLHQSDHFARPSSLTLLPVSVRTDRFALHRLCFRLRLSRPAGENVRDPLFANRNPIQGATCFHRIAA